MNIRTIKTLMILGLLSGLGGFSGQLNAACIPANFDLSIPSNFVDPITFAVPGVIEGGGVPTLSLADSAGNAVSSPQTGTYGSLSLNGGLATYTPTGVGAGTPTDTFHFVVTDPLGCPFVGSASSIGDIRMRLDTNFLVEIDSTPPTTDVTDKYGDFLSRSQALTPNILYTFLEGKGPLVKEVSGNNHLHNQDLHLNPSYFEWKSETTGMHLDTVDPLNKWILHSLNPDVIQGSIPSVPIANGGTFSVEIWFQRNNVPLASGYPRLLGTSRYIECNPGLDFQGFNFMLHLGTPHFVLSRTEPSPPGAGDNGSDNCITYSFPPNETSISTGTLEHLVFVHGYGGAPTHIFHNGVNTESDREPSSVIGFGDLYFYQNANIRLNVIEIEQIGGLYLPLFAGDIYLIAIYREFMSDTDAQLLYAAGPPWLMADLTFVARTINSTELSVTLQGTAPWDIEWSDGVVETSVFSNPHSRFVTPDATTTYSINTINNMNYTGLKRGSVTVQGFDVIFEDGFGG